MQAPKAALLQEPLLLQLLPLEQGELLRLLLRLLLLLLLLVLLLLLAALV
jgi:hypothetical protein